MTSVDIKLSENFKNGIYFSCNMCGACCRGFDEGEVYIYKNDIIRLVKFFRKKGNKFNLSTFAKKHLKIVTQSFYWKEPEASNGKKYQIDTLGFKFVGEDEHCEFLNDENVCTIYKARPFQCRAYPIGWNMLMKNANNFKDYTKKCPALQKSLENRGKFYSRDAILKWAKHEYKIEKDYFLKIKKHNFDIFKLYKFLPKDITR